MANFDAIKHLFNVLSKISDDQSVYKNIQQNEELKQTSKHFGLKTLTHSIMFLLFGALAIFLLKYGLTFEWGIILSILALIIGLFFALISVEYVLFSLAYSIKQLKINRKPISFVALVLFIICVTALTLFAVFIFS